jgi:hypothetical protein
MLFVAYIAKVITQKSLVPQEPDSVFQIILISHLRDIMCVQVHDSNFLIKGAFPSEGSRVICDGIVLDQLMLLKDGQHTIAQDSEYSYLTCTTSNNTSIEVVSAGKI